MVPQGQHHIPSAQQSSALFGRVPAWMGDQMRIPCVVTTSFFSFFFFSFLSKAILVTAELPVSCNVCFSIYELFCSHHFTMFIFIFEVFIYNTA